MSFITDYGYTKMLAEMLEHGGSWYLALFTLTVPGSERRSRELVAEGYARQPVTFTVAGAYAVNRKGICFGKAPVDWGAITGFGVADAPTGGHCIIIDAFTPVTRYTLERGDEFLIGLGRLGLPAPLPKG